MLGAIIGDIVGSRFEWNNHRSKDFEFLTYKCFPTVKNLNSDRVSKVKIHIPSMELQSEFVELAKQSDKSKFALQEAIKDLDALTKKIIAENLIPAGKE